MKRIERLPSSPEEEHMADIKPLDVPPELTGVELHEYECGSPCTENGCLGHDTGVPFAITLDNVRFVVEGYEAGDYPADKAFVAEVQNVVARLEKALLDASYLHTIVSAAREAEPVVPR
jgi:hypothetical protein